VAQTGTSYKRIAINKLDGYGSEERRHKEAANHHTGFWSATAAEIIKMRDLCCCACNTAALADAIWPVRSEGAAVHDDQPHKASCSLPHTACLLLPT
jgi:hypothetical protein